LRQNHLDHTTWPDGRGILEHSILQSLLGDGGFESSPSNCHTDGLLDDQLQTRSVIQVVDADSSQTIALLDAMEGRNMVIQGPPGTGKSQTIVNLIAAALGKGKRVLFVSEKMAALDVVKRRLDKAKLGGSCLELHSNRTNKKTLIEELKRTVNSETLAAPEFQKELALLADSRNRLNAYCWAVNEPIANSGETPCSTYGKLLRADDALQGIEASPLRVAESANWAAVDAARRMQLVQQLQDRLTRSGVPALHPFCGCRLTILLPTDKDQARDLALCAASAGTTLESAARTLAQSCLVPPPSTPTEARFLHESAKFFSTAPDLTGIDTKSREWQAREGDVRNVLDAGKCQRDFHRQYDAILRPDAWGRDVTRVRQVVGQFGGRWWRFLSGKWRHAKQELEKMCTELPPSSQAAQLSLLDAITAAGRASDRIAAGHDTMASVPVCLGRKSL
jgi:hypothetical protein